MTSLGNNGYNN